MISKNVHCCLEFLTSFRVSALLSKTEHHIHYDETHLTNGRYQCWLPKLHFFLPCKEGILDSLLYLDHQKDTVQPYSAKSTNNSFTSACSIILWTHTDDARKPLKSISVSFQWVWRNQNWIKFNKANVAK